MFIFVLFAGTLGGLTGIVRNQIERSQKLEADLVTQRNRMLHAIDSLADGIVITGPDYIIRLMNSRMVREFGEGVGLTCHQHLHHSDTPCPECKIKEVIGHKEIRRWQCRFPNGKTSEIIAAPYTDTDGTECQIAIFRDITPGEAA